MEFLYLFEQASGWSCHRRCPLIAVLEFLYLFELPHLLGCSGIRLDMLDSQNFFIYLKSDIFSEARAPRGETAISLLLLLLKEKLGFLAEKV